MSRCGSCGSPDADPDWGECYECFCRNSDRDGGLRSEIAARMYDQMGSYDTAQFIRERARDRGGRS